MRSFLLSIVLVVVSLSAQSQILGFRHAYSFNFTSLKGLNQVVDNYNETRSWLDQEMKDFGLLDGYAVGFTAGGYSAWIDLEFSGRGQKRKAFGTDLFGNFGTRSLKLKNNTMALTIFGVATDETFAAGFGLRTEFGNNKLKTKIEYEGNDPEWEVVQRDLTVKVGPSIRLINFVSSALDISLTGYFVFGLLKTNHTEADIKLNNTFYNYEKQDKFESNNNTFGIQISVGFLGGASN